MIHLRLLGSTDLWDSSAGDGHCLPTSPRRLALLSYLALARPRGFHRRETLIGLLWAESSQNQARSTLRSTLYGLRRGLPTEVIARRGDEELGIIGGSLECDVLAFEQALQRGDLPGALAVFRGDLMQGFFLPNAPEFQHWLDGERERLREQAGRAALALAARFEAAGDLPQAVMVMRRALSLHRDDETAVRQLMLLLARQGDRAGALRVYHEFASRLEGEYQVEPTPETREVLKDLCERQCDVVRPAVSSAPADDRSADPSDAPRIPLQQPKRSSPEGGPREPVHGSSELHEREIRSIAVLPFVDLSPDRDHEYLADGVSEELIRALAQLDGLRVPARTSSFAFKGQNSDIRVMGRELGVEALLEGSVRKAGNRLRINAQLIDADSGFQRWSDSYDREVVDVFAIQDEIARNIVRALRFRLAAGDGRAPSHRHTRDVEAYRFFLEGRYFWNKRSEEGLRKAITCFRGAIDRDAGYARAFAGLADAYQALASYGHIPVEDARRIARESVEKALALEPTLADAHTSLASILCWEGETSEAEQEYRRAIQLNPLYVTAHHWYATFLRQRGRAPEALAQAEEALELDPLSPVVTFTAGTIYRSLRQYDRSIELCLRASALDPTYAPALYFLACTYAQTGQLNHALAVAERAAVLGDGAALYLAGLGYVQARAGRRSEALRTLQALRRRADGTSSQCDMALIYIGLEEIDRALVCLERAYSAGAPVFREPTIDPIFDPVRSEPRFRQILARASLPA